MSETRDALHRALDHAKTAPECTGCCFMLTDKDGDKLCRRAKVAGEIFNDDGMYASFCADMRQPGAPCGPTGLWFKALDHEC